MKKVIVLLFLVSFANAETYEYVLKPNGTVQDGIIKRLSDGAFIPTNPDNRDYRAFLTDATSIIQMPKFDPPPVDTSERAQAVLDAKNASKTPEARLDALIKALDLK